MSLSASTHAEHFFFSTELLDRKRLEYIHEIISRKSGRRKLYEKVNGFRKKVTVYTALRLTPRGHFKKAEGFLKK